MKKKIKLPNLMSLAPQPKARKPLTRLQAHAHRLTPSAYEDYDEEPSTKLSTAFVVVLVLHIVAVGGVYAFHSIKAKRREADGTAKTPNSMVASAGAPASGQGAALQAPVALQTPTTQAGVPQGTAHLQAIAKPPAPVKADPSVHHGGAAAGPSAVVAQKAGQQPAAAQTPVATVAGKNQSSGTVSIKAATSVPVVQPVAAAPSVGGEAAGKTYTVVKGDNPVAIAKKMGVNYEEMLKLNSIEDPKKLKIGQVLKMPAKKQAN